MQYQIIKKAPSFPGLAPRSGADRTGCNGVDRRLYCALLILLLSILPAGCTGLRAGSMPEYREDRPVRAETGTVPFYAQSDYQCGPAALAMLLHWSGISVTPEELEPEVYTPARKGSLQTSLISAARRHGRIAYPVSGMEAMLTEVVAGHPLIVLLNLGLSWYPKWHYAVVIGYDLSENNVILHSGKTPREHLSFRVFKNTWARSGYWGLLVLSPEELPATVEEDRYLMAVLGLERAQQWHAAVTGYKTALTRWPESTGALMGLGNSFYALSDLTNAEGSFRQAGCLHPDSGPAWNNLAQVLMEQGRGEEALNAARRAVALDGPMMDVFQKTLEEIQFRFPAYQQEKREAQ